METIQVERRVECANKCWDLPLAQKREGKNQKVLIGKTMLGKGTDTGFSALNIRWNSHKVKRDRLSLGSPPVSQGAAWRRKGDASTSYKLCQKDSIGISYFHNSLLGASKYLLTRRDQQYELLLLFLASSLSIHRSSNKLEA